MYGASLVWARDLCFDAQPAETVRRVVEGGLHARLDRAVAHDLGRRCYVRGRALAAVDAPPSRVRAALRCDTLALHGLFDLLALLHLLGRGSIERGYFALPGFVLGSGRSQVVLAHEYLADGASFASREARAYGAEAAVFGPSQLSLGGIQGYLDEVPEPCLDVLEV